MEMNENYQIICKNTEIFYEDIVDISIFKNGSFCLLYPDNIRYYSNIYRFLYDIPLDYNPTHLLTLTNKSKLYAVVRNRKSLYLYLLEDDFIYKTRIDLKDEITYWTKTKDNQILICSKNKISFYEIKNNYFLKTQNDLIIKEETFIEKSPYFKANEEMKEKIKEKEYNSKNFLILKLFELENDYIVIIKKELYEENDVEQHGDCPQCSYYICRQTNFILLSIIKLNKKKQKIKNIYEFKIKNEFEKGYNYEEYYDTVGERKEKNSRLIYLDESIIDTIGIMGNKVLFYNPEKENIEIIDINFSFKQKYKSILYNLDPNLERYKIIFLSENCFYIFKYIYDEDSESEHKTLTFINNNKKRDLTYYDIVLIKKIKSLLFIFDENTLTISKKII